MKILFTISSLRSGGAERVLTTLANSLSINNEVIIVKLDNKGAFYTVKKNIVIESLDLYNVGESILKKVFHNVVIALSIRKSIEYYNPDIIVSFMDRTNIYTLLATRFLDKKIIISERTNYDFIKSKLWKAVRNLVYPLSNGMVVLSKYDYDKYYFVKNKKIIFNPLFLDNSKIEGIEKEKIILAVGSIVPGKAFDILIKSLNKVDKSLLEGWKVYIIGDGVERESLEMMVEELQLKSTIKFLGLKKNIEDYYKKASVFMSTSRAEGFPNALSEALSLGCASIATDCITGPSELIKSGVNGFLVEVDNVDQIKNKLEILIKDKSLRDTFSRRSIEMSKKYNVESIVKEWEVYINEII